jgi:hypothetical protein
MAPKKQLQEVTDILGDLAKDSKPSPVQYLKDGATTIKLLLPAGRNDVRGFYQKFMATFKTEQFPYYLVCGIITEADEDGVADPERVRYIKVTKTVLIEIANLMQNKWKPFTPLGVADPRDCLVVVTRGKKSGKVAYSVTAVPEVFELAEGKELSWPEIDIEEAATEQEVSSVNRDTETADAGGEAIK